MSTTSHLSHLVSLGFELERITSSISNIQATYGPELATERCAALREYLHDLERQGDAVRDQMQAIRHQLGDDEKHPGLASIMTWLDEAGSAPGIAEELHRLAARVDAFITQGLVVLGGFCAFFKERERHGERDTTLKG